MRKAPYLLISVALIFCMTPYLCATNGMFMLSNNARSAGMGGAEIAVPSDCSAISSNPANIASICNRSFALNMSFLYSNMDMDVPTAEGDKDAVDQIFPIPLFSYGDRVGDTNLAYAIGIFAQGGMGASYTKYIIDQNGNKGSLKSDFKLIKFSTTIAYAVLENLSIGASFELGYSELEIDFYPQLPNPPYGGFELQDAYSLSYGAKIGIFYQPTPRLSLGFTYTPKAHLYFEGDFVQRGQKTVDGSLSGFRWPHVFEVGASYSFSERLLVALDVSYINWNESVNKGKIEKDGKHYMTLPMDWKDQVVISVGLEYSVGEYHKIRVGYNYGNNPIPNDTLTPLFPAIVEHHFTIGYGYQGERFGIDIAYEHGFQKREVSEFENIKDYEISHAQHVFHITFKYHF